MSTDQMIYELYLEHGENVIHTARCLGLGVNRVRNAVRRVESKEATGCAK